MLIVKLTVRTAKHASLASRCYEFYSLTQETLVKGSQPVLSNKHDSCQVLGQQSSQAQHKALVKFLLWVKMFVVSVLGLRSQINERICDVSVAGKSCGNWPIAGCRKLFEASALISDKDLVGFEFVCFCYFYFILFYFIFWEMGSFLLLCPCLLFYSLEHDGAPFPGELQQDRWISGIHLDAQCQERKEINI